MPQATACEYVYFTTLHFYSQEIMNVNYCVVPMLAENYDYRARAYRKFNNINFGPHETTKVQD